MGAKSFIFLFYLSSIFLIAVSCDIINFTQNSGTFTDKRDGQVYKWVRIGDQIWMAENLRYKINDGWVYGKDSKNLDIYGRLYTWKAAKAACPEGWHLPTDIEWQKLELQIGGETEGNKLKAKNGWNNNGNGTDDFSFCALPGGETMSLKMPSGYGQIFNGIGLSGNWWTSTEEPHDRHVWSRHLYSNSHKIWRSKNIYPGYHLSVRCVKD